jgi:ATP synthase protein I
MTGTDDQGADKRLMARGVGMYGTLGLEMVLSTLLGYWFGDWLDGQLDTAPWLTIIFLVVGVAAGIKRLIVVVQRALREEMDDDPQTRSGL